MSQQPLTYGAAALLLLASTTGVSADLVTDCKSSDTTLAMRACSVIIEEGANTRMAVAVAHTHRAKAAEVSGDFEQAFKDLNKAIELNPELPGAYLNRGNIHFRRGALASALLDYDAAIRISPMFAGAYYNRGNVHSMRGAHVQAISDLTSAIQLDPSYASAYFNRGVAYLHINRRPDAAKDFKRTLALDSDHAGASQALASLGD